MDMKDRAAMLAAVEGQVHRALQRGAELTTAVLLEQIEIDVAQGKLESPIEIIFAAWWEALKRSHNMEWAWLRPQYEVTVDGQKYRIDFTVYMDSHPGDY